MNKSLTAAAAVLLILIILSAGCVTQVKQVEKNGIAIVSENKYYNPAMSSIPGLDMLPVPEEELLGTLQGRNLTYHWTADGRFGELASFLTLVPQIHGYETINHGNETYTESGEVLWFAYNGTALKDTPEKLTFRLQLLADGEVAAERNVTILRKVMVFYVEDNYFGIETKIL